MRYFTVSLALLSVALLSSLTGCVTTSEAFAKDAAAMDLDKMPLSAEQTAYLSSIKDEALVFNTSAGNAKDFWERALYWVSTQSSMKIQVQNEFTIQTYTPMANSMRYGCYVSRKPLGGGSYELSVQSIPSETMFDQLRAVALKRAHTNSQILAHYIKTGVMREELVAK